MKLATVLLMASSALAQQLVTLPGKSPLVTLRVVFLIGAAYDPPDKPGLANLTAMLLAHGGTKQLTYQQIIDAMYPMATSVSWQVDKEMTTFTGATHTDNLNAFYKLFRAMLLEPGWWEDDFRRIKDDAINYLRVSLRGNNDEELAKEVLYNAIFARSTYGHENYGTVSSLRKMTLDDLRQFYQSHFTRGHVMIGVAGGYPHDFPNQVRKDFEQLPAGDPPAHAAPKPEPLAESHAILIEKNTRSVAFSIGFPIDVKPGDPDYPALLLATSAFGQHRTSGGRLFERMRQLRGLNYGDYAYIEYFPRGMFRFEPDPNLARQEQIFQIWIRPVEPPTAHFALRLALYELDRLVRQGLTQDEFERSRSFLSKYVNLLMRTKAAELGYKIDSIFYRIPDYDLYLKAALAKLTLADVNRAIRQHLRADRLEIVAVGKDMAEFKAKLVENRPSPIIYNSPKPEEILTEDKTVAAWKIALKPEAVQLVPVDQIFE